MEFIFIPAALIFGAIIGSFLNALSFRFNTGRSIANGRSRCMHCSHVLGVGDLVPIFSYLWLGGRCRYCGARISLQYPLVEAAAAFLSLALYVLYPNLLAYIFWLIVWMLLLFIVIYDVRHTIIPWTFSISLLVLSVISLFIHFDGGISFALPNIAALLAGPLLALPLFLICFFSKGTWMGWGDPLLELSLGWFLGFTMGLSAFMLAVWIGALVGIALRLFKRGLTMKSEIPFAPFLALGALIAQLFHVDFFSSLAFLF